ncbi:dendritic cell-specific transmembrane protein [Dasypus novemcinctus]|uniref:dendritic cell-specific transmembrane protein n=1 Tax=Dasypus novemcinctus TaxID=9361 RepID=UPI000328FE78|nr:dendritic cell-specific transmembrane protein [Dasypus novemcinctus]XP_058131883.1 dendritic cell-specific transmembrane protein [Dasypus novemcinctus]XP_058131884.1 dendritic cell-specific transmembrane protein [Dasypus novemcinctus]
MGAWTSGTGIFLSLWRIYVSPRSIRWMDFIQHLGVCSCVAFISMGLLSVAFRWFLSTLTVFTTSWIIMCVLLYCSKHTRCFILLFFLSCGLREGRNALTAAGTGIVIFGHVENILYNFKGLLDSMTCNLRAKSFSIHFPLLEKYIEAIQWMYGLATQLRLFEDLVSWKQTLAVSLFSPIEALEAQLNGTQGEVLNVMYQMVTTAQVVSSVGQKLLAVAGLVLVLFSTGLFMKQFLSPGGWKFENIYITRQFVRFDERERHQQRPCVLPLNKTEKKKYVVVPSFWLTPKERKNLGLFFLPILTHLYIWVLFAAVDYLLYRLIFSVSKHFQSLPGLEVHLKLHTEVQRTQDTIQDSSFNISLFEPNCLPKPRLLLSETWVPLTVILVGLVVLGLLSSTLMQLKILVSTSFYPSMDRERVRYLHAKLLKKRSKQPLGEVRRKLRLYLTKIHFWLPVLKMIRKKQLDIANEENP